ncbi:hypothetical protein D3C84_762730 [compost metagenome]
MKQPGAEGFLQVFDLLADGRLGHAQFLRRQREAAQPRNGLEFHQGCHGRYQSAVALDLLTGFFTAHLGRS